MATNNPCHTTLNVSGKLLRMPRRARNTDDFGPRLRRLRLEHGWTMAELAKRADTTERAILYYELEGKYPPAPALADLATVFEISIEALLGRDDIPAPGHRSHGLNLLEDAEDRRLWKKFRQIRTLSERDQAHLFKTLSMLIESKTGMERSA